MSKFIKKNKKIEENLIGAYKTIVTTYKKIENKFVDTFLSKNNEVTKNFKKTSEKKDNMHEKIEFLIIL